VASAYIRIGHTSGARSLDQITRIWQKLRAEESIVRHFEEVDLQRELNPKQAKQLVVFGWVFVVVGTLAVLFAIGWGVRSFRLQAGANRTTGTVVELREVEESPALGSDNSTGSTWYPVVEYEVDAIKYRIEGVGSNPSWLPHVGEKVEVLYRANQPANGHLNTFLDRWAVPLFFPGVGSIFAALGIFMIRSQRRRA